MNVVLSPGSILCECCGRQMGSQRAETWDPNIAHVLIVCGTQNCPREGKVMKFPVTRVNCTPFIPEKPKLVVVSSS